MLAQKIIYNWSYRRNEAFCHIFGLILLQFTGGSSIESDGSDVRIMEGFTRSLPSSPLLNLRLAKRPGRNSHPKHTNKHGPTLT